MKAVKDFWDDNSDSIKVFLFGNKTSRGVCPELVRRIKFISEEGETAHHYFRKTVSGTVEPPRAKDWRHFEPLGQARLKCDRDILRFGIRNNLLRREDKEILVRQECVLFRKPEAVTFHLFD